MDDDQAPGWRAYAWGVLAALTCPYVKRIDRRGGPSADEVRERLSDVARRLSLA